MKIRGGISLLQFWGGFLIRSQKKAATESKIRRKSFWNIFEPVFPENI